MIGAMSSVRPVSLDDIRAARERIKGVAVRTPLVRLLHGMKGPEIWLKLENLQPINAFKLRGAANAVAMLDPDERSRGVWTISAGNAGQGVAYAAREAGVPCTVVVIDKAAETKVQRMRDLGVGQHAGLLPRRDEELDLLEFLEHRASGEQALVEEVRERMDSGGPALEEEIGDLLFAVVNYARLAGAHSGLALGAANAKFSRRFVALERLAGERGVVLGEASLQELDRLWDEVKAIESRTD